MIQEYEEANMIIKCPHCGNEDKTMIEFLYRHMKMDKTLDRYVYHCEVCSKDFEVKSGDK